MLDTDRSSLFLSFTATTTIGSFPQTKEIRVARAKLGKGELSVAEYDTFIEKEIQTVVEFQEKIGLDLLVHGEPERNDMVQVGSLSSLRSLRPVTDSLAALLQYFGERLTGFVFTEHAWVQSYGSRVSPLCPSSRISCAETDYRLSYSSSTFALPSSSRTSRAPSP